MKLSAGETIGSALGLTGASAGAGIHLYQPRKAAPILNYPQNLKQIVVKSIGF